MALDPRHVTLLLSIAEVGSFSAAAVALNTSQPALSNRIASLERELGVKVFERTRHGVKPTEVGRLLLRHARAMDAVLAQTRREVELKKRGAEGLLAVGTTSMPAYELIPKALAYLAGLNLALSVVDALDEVLMEKLENFELDLVVATLGLDRIPSSSFHQELLAELRFTVVVGKDHKLAHRRAVSLRELDRVQ
jgi:DNA-binding transcriptional LysR family regulator